MKIKNLPNKLIYILMCSLILVSCSSSQLKKYAQIEKPVIKFQKYQVVSVTDKNVKLNILFNVHNPNDITIDEFYMNYELFVDDKSFIKGLKVKLKLIPKGKSVITLPIDMAYKNLISRVTSVTKLMVKGKRNIPIAADIEIFGEFKVAKYIKQDFRYQKKVNMSLPLPKYSTKDVMQFLKGVR